VSLDQENVWEAARVFASTADLLDSMPAGGRVALLGDVGPARELVLSICAPDEVHQGWSSMLGMFEDQHFGWAYAAEPAVDAAEVMRVCNVAVFGGYRGGSVDELVAQGWTIVIGVALRDGGADLVVARRATEEPAIGEVPPGMFELDEVLKELGAQAV
jgi:hypothetical protein